ncbi:hypothetical protein PSTG_09374 [Puccinia striiformis f. sp. tritici PST-78]|uniref:Uncharacterized protein n=1 Tax=Puccinia striiformis f. sp. tritici PST-78 TaxID=1165861 RepID=A0A0L0VDP8_9BASI|nr:hypothetical protein PSTG_09374 [Puccinia striiformis f. sp. tritici PST-78]
MSFHLRARNTATAESQADVLEELELEAGRNVPSPDHNEPNVTKKRSTNIDKFFESDGRLLEPRPPAPSLFSLSSKDKRAMALLVVLWYCRGYDVWIDPSFAGCTAIAQSNRLVLTEPLFALVKAPVVTDRRHMSLPKYRPQEIMNHPRPGPRRGYSLVVWNSSQRPHLHPPDFHFDHIYGHSRHSSPWLGSRATFSGQSAVCINCTNNFLSFTVFVAQKVPEFSNSRWRRLFESLTQDYRMVILSGYLKFGSVCYILVTLYLSFLPNDDSVDKDSPESNNLNVKKVYRIMYEICKLKHVQRLILLHFIVNVGVSVNDIATSSRLLEKGLNKDDMALLVWIDFPFQILLGYFVAKWSSGDNPLQPWIWALWFRLAFSAWNVGLVYFFPEAQPLSNSYLILVIASMAMSGLASTVQFVGISAFHAQVADPLIGGTYMTLLNTLPWWGLCQVLCFKRCLFHHGSKLLDSQCKQHTTRAAWE